MTGREALKRIRVMAARGDIRYRDHAKTRMRERGAFPSDVLSAIASATSCRWQDDHQTWAVDGGVDTDGDELGVRCTIEADVVVYTIY